MAEVGTISAIISVATFGAKTSMVLYDLASTIGSAKRDVTVVARNIAGFCSVLQHLGSTLEKARSSRYSISAIATTQEILDRCQELFQDISDIAAKLLKPENINGSTQSSMSHTARVKWVFKRVKIQKLQAELDSMKLTLHLMLTTLDFAQRISSRRDSGVDHNSQTNLEDKEAHTVAASLLVAQQAADEDIEALEAEASEDDESFELFGRSKAIDVSKWQRTEPSRQSYRASVQLFRGAEGEETPTSQRPQTWTSSHYNMDTRQLFVDLLKRWANCETALERFQNIVLPSDQTYDQLKSGGVSPTPPLVLLPGAPKEMARKLKSITDIIKQAEEEAKESGDSTSYKITVDLSNRGMGSIPVELFGPNNIERLAMSHNYLTNFLVPDRSFPALAYLNIRHNLFRWLPLEITRITSLIILDLGRNKIKMLPDEISNLRNMKVLVFQKNRISEPPTVLGNMKTLKVIKAEGNPFLQLPAFQSIDSGDNDDGVQWTLNFKKLLAENQVPSTTQSTLNEAVLMTPGEMADQLDEKEDPAGPVDKLPQ